MGFYETRLPPYEKKAGMTRSRVIAGVEGGNLTECNGVFIIKTREMSGLIAADYNGIWI